MNNINVCYIVYLMFISKAFEDICNYATFIRFNSHSIREYEREKIFL